MGCKTYVILSALALLLPPARAEDQHSAALRALGQWLAQPRDARKPLAETPFAQIPLDKTTAAAALAALWRDRAAFLKASRAPEMQAKVIELDGQKMKFDWLSFGDPKAVPPHGRSLFISLHGGGGAPAAVNDEQWQNQIKLGQAYKPAEGIYVAPRAPTDAWDMWHQSPVDDFFARLIEDFVVFENVDPNRVFILGYSAGGDGVYQLAPRMADRWAAASMMAGHPNDASPLGLRNVPFSIQVGANDSAYHRNDVAAEWGKKLDALQQADPQGYIHFTEIHAGKGHWMDLEDRKAVPWMEKFTRNPLPEKVVWFQNNVTHTRCYWLARPKEEVKAGQQITATRKGQEITLASADVRTVTVLLNDAMLDLDQPVTIRAGGKVLFTGKVTRTIATLVATLDERGDPDLAFSASVTITMPAAAPASAEQALQSAPEAQREGIQFLLDNMPPPDRANLPAKFLLENTALAYAAHDAAPWAKQIPPGIFLNDVLPYAVLDETRDASRAQLHDLCAPLVKDARTPGEAALLLNQKLFPLVKVHYSTERMKADQSPLESMQSGLASCTGLSILLVDACRSVGVPARIAGTPMWSDNSGNHTWVEVWDNGAWHFLGASEPDAAGLDHAWFIHNASLAVENDPSHAIYASTFKQTSLAFPLAWAPGIHWINAVNVTARYAKPAVPALAKTRLLIKVLDANGKRVAARVTLSDPADAANTSQGDSRDETADTNNILPFDWPPGASCVIRADYNGQTRRQTVTAQKDGEQVVVIRFE